MKLDYAFRIKMKSSIVLAIVCLLFAYSLGVVSLQSSTASSNSSPSNSIETLKEYTFNELGIVVDQINWSGKGTIEISINKTFDLENNGPIVILLEFYTMGDKPDSPGYAIEGQYNNETFETSIQRWMIDGYEDSGIVKQLVIPLESEARVYGNFFELTIEAKNNYDGYAEGLAQILGTSKFLIGDNLLIEDYGQFSTKMYNNKCQGHTTIGGIRRYSYVQLTINNETLLSKSDYYFGFTITIHGEVSASLFLYDSNFQSYSLTRNETDDYTTVVTAELVPHLGVNIFTLETAIYGQNLLSSSFNITISDVHLNVEYSGSGGFGFGDLEIAFFNWPSYPIVGVIILALWVLPYSVLKFRDWKKMPGEVEINFLEDENAVNILDPEGLSVTEEDDDIDETFELEEDE